MFPFDDVIMDPFVQILACHLFGPKPLTKSKLIYIFFLDHDEQTVLKFQPKYPFENIWKISAILSWFEVRVTFGSEQ